MDGEKKREMQGTQNQIRFALLNYYTRLTVEELLVLPHTIQ